VGLLRSEPGEPKIKAIVQEARSSGCRPCHMGKAIRRAAASRQFLDDSAKGVTGASKDALWTRRVRRVC